MNSNSTEYIIRTVLDNKGIIEFERSTQRINDIAGRLGKQLNGVTSIISDQSKVFTNAKGTFEKHIITFTDGMGKMQKAIGIYQNVNGQMVLMDKGASLASASLGKLNSSSTTLIENMGKLAARAMMTIPVWLLLRGVVMSVINSFKEGIQYIIELDKTMARMGAVIQGVGDKSSFIIKLKSEIKSLSSETGKSVEEIGEIFYRFAETGMDAETALAGMNTAAKLSVATFQDTKDVARILVDLYNNLGNTITDVNTPLQKMQEIAGVFTLIWKENAGDLNEYIEALKPLTPVAKEWGLTMKETIATVAVLNTFMQRGSTGGTQLARSLMEITQNSDKVALALGKNVGDVLKMTPFEKFIALLKEFKSSSGNQNTTIFKTMTDIFGERAVKSVAALAGGFDKLIDSLDKVDNMKFEELKKIFESATKEQIDTLDIQINRMGELKKQFFEAFITGITGATDYLQALKNINSFIENTLIPGITMLGIIAKRSLPDKLGERVSRMITPYANPDLVMKQWGKNQPTVISNVGSRSIGEEFKKWDTKFRNSTPEEKFGMLKAIGLTDAQALNQLGWEDASYLLELKKQYGAFTGPNISTVKTETVSASTASFTTPEYNTLKDYTKLTRESLDYELKQVERLKNYGYNQIEIEKAKLEIMLQRKNELKDEEEITKQILKIQEAINKSYDDYVTSFSGSLKEAFTNKLSGGSWTSFGNTISKTLTSSYINEVATGLTNSLMKTGVGNVFAGSLTSLKNSWEGITGKIKTAFDEGGMTTYNWIIRGFSEAQNVGTAGWTGTPTITGGGATSSTNYWNTYAKSATTPYSNYYGNSGYYPGGYSSLAGKGYKDVGYNDLLKKQFYGGLTQSALTGYSAYQSASAGGLGVAGSIASGVFGAGAAIAGTMGGLAASTIGSTAGFGAGAAAGQASLLGLTMGPVGWAILGASLTIASILPSLFSSGKTTTTETKTSETVVASKIDVTNKSLEIINRNLIALKNSVETYILPDSAYFSTKSNTLEDQWVLMSSRGLLG